MQNVFRFVKSSGGALRHFSLLGLFGFSLLAFLLLALQPINSLTTRGLTLISACVVLFSLGLLLWPRKIQRWIFLTALALVSLWLLLPGSPVDRDRLRSEYLAGLLRYSGTIYIWGGETHAGIDCSGLPRAALRDALFLTGLTTFNPRPVREAIALWWRDASARSLATGLFDQTIPANISGVLNTLPMDKIPPGALAITTSGVHCLVYLGDSRWIQADPGVGRVDIFDARTTYNPWFNSPVTIHEWTLLNPPTEK